MLQLLHMFCGLCWHLIFANIAIVIISAGIAYFLFLRNKND